MTRTLAFAALALAGFIFVTPAEAQRGRGGGGGGGAGRAGGGFSGGGRSMGGGGFSGGRPGGSFGGSRPSSGGGMSFSRPSGSFGGSRPSGSFGGSRLSSPGSSGLRSPSIGSLRSPAMGGGSVRGPSGSGIRTSPSIGLLRPSPSIGNLRATSGLGSAVRPSPDLGARAPRLNLGSSDTRPGNNATPRIIDGAPGRTLSPLLNSGLGDRGRGDNRPASDAALRGPGQSAGARLGQSDGRPNVDLRPGRDNVDLRQGRDNDGRPGRGNGSLANGGNLGRANDLNPRSGTTNLRPNFDGIVSRGRGAGGFDGANRAAAGRVTPQNLDNFLALRGRNWNGGTGNSITNTNISNTNIVNNRFQNINVTQINRINTNINAGFGRGYGAWNGHHHHGGAWNGHGHHHHHGWGYGWRSPYWNNWAGGVRGYWNFGNYYNCFTPRFWATNYCHFPWRRSYYWWGAQPWTYWWNTPNWGNLCNWFPTYGWSDPYYYGYGPGGNIAFNSGYVYLNEEPIATVEEYAASAAELATVPTPVAPDKPTEWMPLGTFVLSQGPDDKNPERVVQLAVDKDGIVSGTMVNQETKQTYPIQGRVDKETQRVAFTIGNNKDVVFETGIYNLTQQQTPVLALTDGREETYLLLRLEEPKPDGTAPPPTTATPSATTTARPAPGDDIPPPPPPAPDDRVR